MDPSAALLEAKSQLSELPPRPQPDEVEKSRRALLNIDAKLYENLEKLMNSPAPPGMSPENFNSLTAQMKSLAVEGAETEKLPHISTIDLDKKHSHYNEIIRLAEIALLGGEKFAESQKLAKESIEIKLSKDIETASKENTENLDLSCNDAESIPESIGNLNNLQVLDLSRNLVKTLPVSLFSLRNLTVLNLHSNQISVIPESIGLLQNLKFLDASKNRITSFPRGLSNCASLEELNLSFNKIEELPADFGDAFPSLTRLYLGLNQIQLIPDSVCKMTNLIHLDLHFNKVKALPENIGQLFNLEQLDVSENFSDLEFLPESIGNLQSLICLSLRHNQIQSLPLSVGNLKRLEKLELEGNPWREPPLELVEKRNVKEILSYLQEKASSGENTSSYSPFSFSWLNWFSQLTDNWSFVYWLNQLMHRAQQQRLENPPEKKLIQLTDEDLNRAESGVDLPMSSSSSRPLNVM